MRVVGVGEVAVARAAVCAHEGVGAGVKVAVVGDPAAALELDAGDLPSRGDAPVLGAER